MKTVFTPIIQAHSVDTGIPMVVAALKGATADGLPLLGTGPLSMALTRYAASGGAVKLSYQKVGVLELVDAQTFALTLGSAATRMIRSGVVKMLAVELDQRGEVSETWLADKDSLAKACNEIGNVMFQKMQERRPMTSEQLLTEALQKVYESPGFLKAPGAFAKPIQEFNPQPARRQQVPPEGEVHVSELARANENIRTIGRHLKDAMTASPGNVSVADAGLLWTSLDRIIGLGIDSRYVGPGAQQSVAVTPNAEALREAWGKLDRNAGGFLDFRKALTKVRAQPQVMSRNGAGQVFSKAADGAGVDSYLGHGEGESEQDILRRHALETVRGHLKVLGDKILAAREANPDRAVSSHLLAAAEAHRAAVKHVNVCLGAEE